MRARRVAIPTRNRIKPVDAAVDKFRELVGSLKSRFTSFESMEAVYLYDVTEVKRMPSDSALATRHWRTLR
jgi:hypothetical protein